jgi:hypothetical protein
LIKQKKFGFASVSIPKRRHFAMELIIPFVISSQKVDLFNFIVNIREFIEIVLQPQFLLIVLGHKTYQHEKNISSVSFFLCNLIIYRLFNHTTSHFYRKRFGVQAWINKDGIAEIQSLEKTVDLPGKISSIKNKGYLITYRDKDNEITGSYIAFLARIGKHLYFDYYPVPLETEKNADEFYMQHFVKMHTPFRVNILKNGSFELNQLESNYLDKLIEEKKIRIRHELNSDGDAVITASTEELQQYILKYGDDPEVIQKEKTVFSKTY